MKTKICLPLLLFLLAGAALRGSDVLERTVSVRFDQVPLKQALTEIARQGGFEWSYNASILDESRRVTLVAEGWTVRETLVYLLGDAYTYKQNGEYLILKRQKKPQQQRLSGYVSDYKTGQKMAGVTVYDRKTLRSTTTNKHGYYELPVGDRSEIVVSKLAYRDTVLRVSSQTPRLVKLDLYADSLPHSSSISLREGMNRMAV
ncbi:MAG: carboxypeptidase-like regulatory domain-containing protein, partial [Thermoanaerobaculia bacterium]|nr:carboxypeptidase-like regulatory domain-containing protein [Thermoanaerobaculia bacterium]